MKIQRILILLVFVIVSCTPQPTAAPTIVEEPTNTSIPAVPVASDTPENVPETTATALPATSTPEFNQRDSELLSLITITPCNVADQPISRSPRLTWVMVFCKGYSPGDGTTTKIVRLDDSQRWVLSFKNEYIIPNQPKNVDMSSLQQKNFIPISWTKDEKFAYLAVQTSDEDSPFKGYDALYRLDLSIGKLRPTLKPAVGLATSYSFKFSPGGTMLVYFNQLIQPLTITILNTGTGDETKFTLDSKFTRGGSFLWSPDEKQLIVSVLDQGANGGNSVILFDLETKKNEYLVQQSPTVYLPIDWVDGTTIYAESYPGSWVYIDTTTKVVTSAPSPTPTP